MKKIIFSATALLLTTLASAQVIHGNRITERTKLGIHAGWSNASQSVSEPGDSYENNARHGITVGISAEMPIKKGLYFQPELNYANMGSRYFSNKGEYLLDNFNYLQIPLLLKYRPLFQGFAFFGGPQISYLANAKGYILGSNQVADLKKLYEPYDISGIIGAEYYEPSNRFNDKKARFGIGARFQFGMSDIIAPHTMNAKNNISVYNNAFYITAGIRF